MIESLLMFFIHDALFLLGYLARGSAFPKPLSREEEAEMIARMQQGDERARETLIEHNLRLADFNPLPSCEGRQHKPLKIRLDSRQFIQQNHHSSFF